MKKRKLKIIYLDFDDVKNPLLNAGQARATYAVASRLIKKGHKVLVISSKYPNSKDRIQDGIEYKHIGLGSQFIRLNNVFYIFSLPFAISKVSGDVIVECFTPPFSTLFTPLLTRIPVVALPSMFNAKEFSKKYHLPFHWIERIGVRFYKYILPYSKVDSEKARKLNPNILFKIIPQGVDKKYFLVKNKKPEFILYYGRYDVHQKGTDLLVKAFSKISNKSKFPLVLAGFGADEAKLRGLIKKFNLENKVKLIGPIRKVKKLNVFSRSLYNTFPSRHDEMCLGTLEVLASGIPVVAFDLPESRWMTLRVCLKAEPYDIDEYSRLLLKAQNLDLINRMRANCRKFAQNFTWENVAQKTESFLQYVVRKEGGGN